MRSDLKSIRQTIRAALPERAFRRAPSRLVVAFAALFVNIATFCWLSKFLESNRTFSLATFGVLILVGLLLGHMNAVAAFVSHEILHGSVVAGRRLQDALAFLLYSPFQMSPTFWRYWHNHLHHRHTQDSVRDPDAYPRYAHYRSSALYRRLYRLAPGAGTIMSYFYLFYWFSFQTIWNQSQRRYLEQSWRTLNHRRVDLEFGMQLVGAFIYIAAVTFSFGWFGLIACVMVPFFTQNYLLMSYIATNHNLSSQTRENDPFENSLSVQTLSVFDFLHGNFGYHVEHHLFPALNPWELKRVHHFLTKEKMHGYKCFPKWKAIRLLYATPRIYKDRETLFDPVTRREIRLADLD